MAHKVDYQEMLKEMLIDLNKVTILALQQSGVKKDSNLSKSVNYVEVKNGVQLEVAYYYHYVSAGRKRGIRKVPIKALLEYIKDKGIRPRAGQTLNQLAFAIQKSIYKEGINPKNFETKVENVAADLTMNEMANMLAESIADELVDTFNIN